MAKSSGGGGDRHQQASVAGMVLIRIFLGLFFLYHVLAEMLADPAGFIAAFRELTGPSGQYVVTNEWPAYAEFLSLVVSPHAQLVGWLIVTGELLFGIMLLIGLLTRLAALGTLAISLFFLLATLWVSGYIWGMYAALIAMEVAVIIAAAGRTWGLDALIARRTRLKLLW
jgi:thiosulfate dehydrogenase [quinone] large subunit